MEVLQRTANRGSISTGYDIDNSVKLEDANNEWFYNASPTAGNRRTYTFSFWVKRTEIGTVNASGNQFVIGQGQHGRMYFGGDFFQYRFDDGHDCRNVSRKFRDTSAWYHFVVAVDTNQLTSSNRVKLYVNGESLAVDDHDGGSFPDLADQGAFFSTNYLTLGTAPFGGSFNVGDGDYDMSGYLSEFCAVDGQQLTPTDFGEFDSDSGIWKPIDVSGLTFGSEGFYLNFATAGDLGDDKSGNGNDLTENNLAAADQATDTPTNNFCTFNPLINQNNPPTISEGAMKSTGGGGTWNQTWGNMGVQNGKWYYEFKVTNTSSTGYFGASTAPAEGSYLVDAQLMYNTSFMVGEAASIDYYYWQNGSQVSDESTGWGTISTNDIIGIALDLDAATKTFTVYKNGTALSGTLSQPVDLPTNMQDEFIFPLYVQYENNADEANFGGYTTMSISSAESDANGYGTFEYAPPSGYYALCTKNLAEFG
jgi:hypothetical protein